MSDGVSDRFRLTADDVAAAAGLYSWSSLRQPRTVVSLLLAWLLGLAFLSWLVLGAAITDPAALLDNASFLLALSASPFVAIAALMLVMVPITARRTFHQQRSLQGELGYRWSAGGLGIDTEYADFDMPWTHFQRWAEDGRSILLFESDRLYRVIPKRVLTADQQTSLRHHLAGIGMNPPA